MRPVNRILTLVALSTLVLGAMAVPAMAHDGDDGPSDSPRGPGDREARCADDNATATDDPCAARDGRRGPDDHARERSVAQEWKARCADDNATANATEDRCHDASAFAHDAKQARRASHALLAAQDGLEHRITRLEMAEYRIRLALEGGNLTDNETADLEAKLERIQDAQDKMLEKFSDLQARIDALKERWDDVDEHVREHQAEHDGSDAPEEPETETPET